LHISPFRVRLAFGFLIVEPSSGAIATLRAAETIGRPLGGPAFLERGRVDRPRSARRDARRRDEKGICARVTLIQ
jgi:hypothetical protein